MVEPRVGTSGWSYPEWVGRFYPNGTSAARMLNFYGHRFDAVEAHSTYRRLPSPETLARWTEQVPADFRFVPKAHLAITHRRDLDGLDQRVEAFLASVAPLGGLLGPILFSPPQAEPDLVRLDRLLEALPPPPDGPLVAFDLKPSWARADVAERLDAHGAALVITDSDASAPDPASAGAATQLGRLTYVRLRRDRYDRAQLEAWARRLTKAAANGGEVYAFVKHDEMGDGPRYARQLAAAVRNQQ